MRLKVNVTLIMTLLIMPVVVAYGTDLHKFWDDRCYPCHEHSGKFSRDFLKVSNSELQGQHHSRDLRLFLSNHYLAGHNVEPIYNMLLAQASITPRFKNECSSCHENAAKFVRESFIFHDDLLYSRKLKVSVRDFLAGHRNLQPADVDFFMEQLNRIAHEVELIKGNK